MALLFSSIKWSRKIKCKISIELGPRGYPIVLDGATIDIIGTPTYKFNANNIPWNLKDKEFDIFIGLQVLEHLDDKISILKEIKRISNKAIISLPLEWKLDINKVNKELYDTHNLLTLSMIEEWFNAANIIPTKAIICPPWRNKRIIYIFDNFN